MDKLYAVFSYPFGWILWLLYHVFDNNYALALIAFTLIAKLLLLPTSISTQKSQAKNLRTRSKIEKIKKKYAGDQARMNAELQNYYEKEGFGSMTGGFGTLLIQFPIIMGLYGAIYRPLSYIIRIDNKYIEELKTAVAELLGSSAKRSTLQEINVLSHVDELRAALPDIPSEVFDKIQNFNFTAFGFDLGSIPQNIWKATPAILIVPVAAFLAALIQSIYTMIMQKKSNPDMANNMSMGCMFMMMSLMSLWLTFQFPIGIGIYWAVNSILGFIQTIVLNKIYEPKKVIAKAMVEETKVRKSKEKSIKENIQLVKNMEEAHD